MGTSSDISETSFSEQLYKEQLFSGARDGGDFSVIFGDPVTGRVLAMAESVAMTPATVLLTGESGTGKEVFARFIHARSRRADKEFVALNCAAIPEQLLESELFGHEKGSFSGAVKQHIGVFERADGGTLLLDEITEMPLELQAKLLRVIQERELLRVGGTRPVKIDIRIIATSNRDLIRYVEEGKFRRDLYYRINVFPLALPPLRSRKGDIEPLMNFYVDRVSNLFGKEVDGVSKSAIEKLKKHGFPGNVRELVNIAERAIIMCGECKTIEPEHILIEANEGMFRLLEGKAAAEVERVSDAQDRPTISFKVGQDALTDIRRIIILETLREYDGNRTRAAETLGVSARTIRNKLKDYREAGILDVDFEP